MASGLSHRAQAPAMLGGGDMSQAGIANSEDTLIARWARAWSTQDASLFLSLFADDAHYCDVALDKAFRGREAAPFWASRLACYRPERRSGSKGAVSCASSTGGSSNTGIIGIRRRLTGRSRFSRENSSSNPSSSQEHRFRASPMVWSRSS